MSIIPLKKRTDKFIKKIEVWKIPNVDSYLLADSKKQFDHEFNAGFYDEDKWIVSVIIKISEIKHSYYVSAFAVGPYNSRFQVFSKIGRGGVSPDCKNLIDMENSIGSGFPIKTLPPHESYYIPNGTLTLEIEITSYWDTNPCFPGHPHRVPNIDSYVPDSLLELYQTRNDDGNVIIKVENNEFKIHKNVLETRCPVLNELIDESNLLALEDIKPQVFEMVVEYLYTGYVSNTNDQLVDNAECLLEAVDAKILAIRCKCLALSYCLSKLHSDYLTHPVRYPLDSIPVIKRGYNPLDLYENERFPRPIDMNDSSCTL
ncbi:Similar to SPOPL: Speckle-type POZ protein-like (Homo sapiens) [Cotesia congregata]|uniref:Similar to SPOPL: Speckle-type POZ protein-like (Homo sapiens) n=1 Tax=Cotesia congregata TaxID=51543 RepID=A0A8J2H8V8_COTCN|nr:Similar to SPOPL: Speckle-type POZ protein-like (Homo sapiens) [Cotesia congregata]